MLFFCFVQATGPMCLPPMCKDTFFSSFLFAFLLIFRNFAIRMAKLLRLGKKRTKFLCFALDFS